LGRVLDFYDKAYSAVEINKKTKEGTYIFSYWNSIPMLSLLHTVAISYDGKEYMTYNYKQGINEIIPSEYSSRFIC